MKLKNGKTNDLYYLLNSFITISVTIEVSYVCKEIYI